MYFTFGLPRHSLVVCTNCKTASVTDFAWFKSTICCFEWAMLEATAIIEETKGSTYATSRLT